VNGFTAWEELETRVIRNNLCTYCGACTGMCPYFLPYNGHIVPRDRCSLDRGRCLAFCPRIGVDMDGLHGAMFDSPYEESDIGLVKDIFIGRAVDREILSRGQYGGVVTALGSVALEEGMVDSVVATDSRDKCLPLGRVVSTKADLARCAGSSYVASPTLEAFNRAAREDSISKMAVICTPCQALALANMRFSDLAGQNGMDTLKLVIGIFCTWALSSEGFVPYLEGKVPLEDVVKVDIPPPPADTFDVYCKTGGRVSLPLGDVRPHIREACTYCIDMTAEFTDVSVGAAEGIEGWNTVIVRSGKGVELIGKAVNRGAIEIGALPGENLQHLKDASLAKKKRSLKNICRKTGRADDFLYLKNCPAAIRRLLEG
jgi:coenzyme F420 hydrogenase subunit beta